ncbi:MAG TPA: DNA polymerase III subunit gamma/tau [Kofleriaceae bacterium]|nr:DNA polymerase III subunit gamma/tau [Kofleriaceae bacterium]
MSYLVLARKYRPSTFAEVVGQEHVTRTLRNAFATGRVHHAFLFCGPRGCGKTTLARIVGKALNCQGSKETRQDAAEPCGVCAACTSIGNGSAVDYQEMDGASNRGIDAIRELTEAVRYQPAVLRKKVYVIDEVHMLTTEAFNALLKTLEEPPPHVTFVLATTEPHKLPNTILSRCQRYDFKLVPASRLAQHLTSIFVREQLSIEPGAVSLVVRESGGSVRDALSLCDQLISYVGDATMTERHVAEVLGVADRALTRTLVRALAAGDAGEALAAVDAGIERGVDEVQLARAIVRYLRDLSVLQVTHGPDGAGVRRGLIDASEEELAELTAEAAALERSRVTQMFERMLRCCDELGKTLQPRLVLDCALIDVATVEPLVPLGDLLERLGELEARLAGKPARAAGGGGGTKDRPRPPTAPAGGAAAPRPAPPGRTAMPAPAAATAGPAATAPPVARPASPTPLASAPASPSSAPMSPSVSSPASPASAAPAAPVESSPASAISGPVSMQPSGPVPRPDTVASGSGPHDIDPRDAKRPLSDPAARNLGVPGSPAEALRAWNEVLSELEGLRKLSLLGPFQHARVLSWTADVLELGFPDDVHSMGEMARDNTDELRTIVRGLGPAQKNVRVTVRLLDAGESKTAGARSVLETTRERTTAERSKREAEAREHPITKHVLQTFGAQIKEIKTDV